MSHPDVGVDFVRKGDVDTWEITQTVHRFHTLTFRIPAAFTNIASVQIKGRTRNGAPIRRQWAGRSWRL